MLLKATRRRVGRGVMDPKQIGLSGGAFRNGLSDGRHVAEKRKKKEHELRQSY